MESRGLSSTSLVGQGEAAAPSDPALWKIVLAFLIYGTLNLFLNFLELIRLAPKGSGKVREMLRQAQLGLVVGGQTGLFTPMYFVCARKPLK